MKLAAFDLETLHEIPEDGDWELIAPVGISCAAVAFSDLEQPAFWMCIPQITRAGCQQIVADLQKIVSRVYMLVTWNGCGFDFAVLAQESGMYKECAALALQHVYLMLIVTFTKSCFLGICREVKKAFNH